MTETGIFAAWWRFHGELLVSPPTQAQWHVALLREIAIGAFTTTKRCASETAQARDCKSSVVHFASGFYRPLGGD